LKELQGRGTPNFEFKCRATRPHSRSHDLDNARLGSIAGEVAAVRIDFVKQSYNHLFYSVEKFSLGMTTSK
jgi:hypothetical protein